MLLARRLIFQAIVLLCLSLTTQAQIDEICREAGVVPSLDSPFANIPYVYGRVSLSASVGPKAPKITVIFWDREQTESRWTVGATGYYCFRRNNASGGLLVVEVNGAEAARRTLPSLGPNQQREDFEVMPPELQKTAAPIAISAKFARTPNEKTIALYKRASDAEKEQNIVEAIRLLNEIVSIDDKDFVAWAKLGTLQFEQQDLDAAIASFRRSLEIRVDYTPAWTNVGKLRMAQKQFEAAAEIFNHVLTLEPGSARVYQMLGKAYLQARKGSLAVGALNEAIRLDPVGMAECHLDLARLYDLARAKDRAANEYKLFLEKVTDHPDRQKFQAYVKENSGK